MKRSLIALPVLLALSSGLWLIQAAYSYYFTQTYPSSGSNWTTTVEGILVHNSTPGTNREVKMTLDGTNYAQLYLGVDVAVYDDYYAVNTCYVTAYPLFSYMSLNCGGSQLALIGTGNVIIFPVGRKGPHADKGRLAQVALPVSD